MGGELMVRIPSHSIPHRREFHSAKKYATESMLDWLNRLKELAVPCNYGSYAEALLINQFIMGLDDSILERLYAVQDDLSLPTIIDLGRNYEFEQEHIAVKPEAVTIKEEEPMADYDGYNDSFSNDEDNADDNYVGQIEPEISIISAQTNESIIATPLYNGSLDIPRMFECYCCHKTFKTVGHLQYHYARYHTIGQTMKCHLCGKWVRDPSNMIRHLNRHFNVQCYSCNLCDSSFTRSVSLNRHMIKHNETNVQLFTCSKCDKKFIFMRHLRKHEKTHELPTISISQKLDEMMKEKNKIKAPTKFNCDICSQLFEDESSLDNHMTVHCETEWLCHLCGKTLKNKRNLIYHYRVHNGDKPFKCEVCDRNFSRKEKLKLHSKTHTGIRPHVCLICNRSFIQKGHLIKHSNSHVVKDLEFKCDQCPKQFSDENKFNIHLRIHAGLKPYPCRTCDKAFKQPSHRTEHERIHSGEKNFQCHICYKRFTQRNTLSGHLKWHAKPKVAKPKKSKKKSVENKNDLCYLPM